MYTSASKPPQVRLAPKRTSLAGPVAATPPSTSLRSTPRGDVGAVASPSSLDSNEPCSTLQARKTSKQVEHQRVARDRHGIVGGAIPFNTPLSIETHDLPVGSLATSTSRVRPSAALAQDSAFQQQQPLHDVGSGGTDNWDSHSAASRTSSQYLYAIQRDLETITRLQQQQLLAAAAAQVMNNTPKHVKATSNGSSSHAAPPLLHGAADGARALRNGAEPHRHLRSIVHDTRPLRENKKGLETEIPPTRSALAAHTMHMAVAAPPPPPPSSSPIPASLVEYQRYLMQLEHQQQQHREVLRRHRAERHKEKKARRGVKPAVTAGPAGALSGTPLRQQQQHSPATTNTYEKSRRERSPPLALMAQAMRPRPGYRHLALFHESSASSSAASSMSTAEASMSSVSQAQLPHRTEASPSDAAMVVPMVESTERTSIAREDQYSRHHHRISSGSSNERKLHPALPTTATPGRRAGAAMSPERRGAAPSKHTVTPQHARHSPPPSTRYPPQRETATRDIHEHDLRHPLPEPAAVVTVARPSSSSPVEAFADALLLDGGGREEGPTSMRPSPTLFAGRSSSTGRHTVTAASLVRSGTVRAAPAPIVFSITAAGEAISPAPRTGLSSLSTPAAEMPHGRRSDAERSPSPPMRTERAAVGRGTPTGPMSRTASSRELRHANAPYAAAGQGRAGGGLSHAPVTTTTATPPSLAATPPGRNYTASAEGSPPVPLSRRAESTPRRDPNKLLPRDTTGRHHHPTMAAMVHAEGSNPTEHSPWKYRYHHHHHLSGEGISSLTPEYGTGTPRSSRYRYKGGSSSAQHKQQQQQQPRESRRPQRRQPRTFVTTRPRGGPRRGASRTSEAESEEQYNTPTAERLRAAQGRPRKTRQHGKGEGCEHRSVPSPQLCDGGTRGGAATWAAARPPQKWLRSTQPSPAALWRDVKLMWAPGPAPPGPFAAAFCHPAHAHPARVPTELWDALTSSAEAESVERAAVAEMRRKSVASGDASFSSLAGPKRVVSTPPEAQQRPSPPSEDAPLLCMTDSLIGAALRDVIPVCRARQQEVAREVTRRRYQLMPAVAPTAH